MSGKTIYCDCEVGKCWGGNTYRCANLHAPEIARLKRKREALKASRAGRDAYDELSAALDALAALDKGT